MAALAKGSIPASSLVISQDEELSWKSNTLNWTFECNFIGSKDAANLFNAPEFQKISGPHLQLFGLGSECDETRTQLPGLFDNISLQPEAHPLQPALLSL